MNSVSFAVGRKLPSAPLVKTTVLPSGDLALDATGPWLLDREVIKVRIATRPVRRC